MDENDDDPAASAESSVDSVARVESANKEHDSPEAQASVDDDVPAPPTICTYQPGDGGSKNYQC